MVATQQTAPTAYSRYVRKIRANLHYLREQVAHQPASERLALFPLVCRAAMMGSQFEETVGVSTEFVTDLFDYAQWCGNFADWSATLAELRDKTVEQSDGLTPLNAALHYKLQSQLGQFLNLSGDHDAAIVASERALLLATEQQNAAQMLNTRINLAVCYLESNKFAAALPYLHGIEGDLAAVQVPTKWRVAAYAALATVALNHQRKPQRAVELYAKALAAAEGSPTASTQAALLQGQGEAYIVCGEFDNALNALNRANELLDDFTEIRKSTHLRTSLGNLYFMQALWADALQIYESIPLEQLEIRGYKQLQAITCNNLGAVYTKRKQWEKAEQRLKEALGLWASLEDTANYANTLGALGELSLATGQTELGIDQLEEALRRLQVESPLAYIQQWIEEFSGLLAQAKQPLADA